MFSDNLEKFRTKKGLFIKDFCEITQIVPAQYHKYKTGKAPFLQITDAVKLLAGFPEDIDLKILCEMADIPAPAIDRSFPELAFIVPHGFYKSNKRFRKYVLNILNSYFPAADAVEILSSFQISFDIFSDDFIRTYPIQPYITDESQFALMAAFQNARQLKISDLSLSYGTAKKHLLRQNKISRFCDLCMYERAFESQGLFLLSEMLFSAAESGVTIYLR